MRGLVTNEALVAGRARPWEMYQGTAALLLVAGLTALRFAIAPVVPLAFDEAYYWRWSTHLAFGYFDHPPLVAWLIAAGTWIAGDTEFGIRLVPLVLSVPASWAVWRSAEILFGDRNLAMTALVFFNLVLIVSVGTVLATPDASLLCASAFLLYCLAKISKTGRPVWWIAAGLVTGIGCLAKFTALFWLPSVFLWLLLVPQMRRWLATPWPWLGAVTAIVVFFPNLAWNATHDWITFGKQFGRVNGDTFAPHHLIDHLAQQIGMATPVIFLFGWLGLAAFMTRRGGPVNSRVLLGTLVWPTTAYFIFHGLHDRVEGNWTGPIFPAFVVAAAAAIHTVDWHGGVARVANLLRPWASPVGLIVVLVVYTQTLWGWLPVGAWDPTANRLGVGVEAMAAEIEAMREAEGAALIVTTGYPTTGWLSYYSPVQPAPVQQINERERWTQEPAFDPAAVDGPLLLVVPEGRLPELDEGFGAPEYLTTLTRTRGDLEIASYDIYLLPNEHADE
jgi:4-amino-4-deoxy-L-arabinose transferase-like glycosyltransferase